jgi:hypothetical protein
MRGLRRNPSWRSRHRRPDDVAYLTTPLVGVVSLGVVGQLGEPALVGGVSIGALVFDIAFVTFTSSARTTGLTAQARRRRAPGDRRDLLAGAGVGASSRVVLLACKDRCSRSRSG